MYQKKDGDGSLFINGYKQKDSHPDMRGDLLLDGKEYEIAGWKKSTRAGDPWYSLKVQPKRAKPDDRRPERGVTTHVANFDSSVPTTLTSDLDSDLPF